MLTEGRVRAIAAQVASAIMSKIKPSVSDEQIRSDVEAVIRQMQENGELTGSDLTDEQIAAVQKNAEAAAGSATTASKAAEAAQAAQGKAETAQTAAESAKSTAAQKATDATNAAQTATSKATEAAEANAAAQTAKGEVQTAATNAGKSATAASESAANAEASEEAAATSESNAAKSATAAAGSATTASKAAAAAQTAQSKAESAQAAAATDRTAAESARDQAKQSETDAANSAGTASTAAANATSAKTAAETAKSEAQTAASNAGKSATAAAGSATTASNAATAAQTAQGKAETAQAAAEAAKSTASQKATEATNAAQTAASKATEVNEATNAAQTAKNEALAAAQRAEEAANRWMGVAVVGIVETVNGKPAIVLTGAEESETLTAYYKVVEKDGTETLVEIGVLKPKDESEPNTYTITWIVDGKTTTTTVEEGVMPTFTGSTDKAADANYTYTFTGWAPTVVAATADATYTAQYSKTAKPVEPNYTNLAVPASSEWKTDVRYDSNNAEKPITGEKLVITNLIKWTKSNSTEIHIKGLDILGAISNGNKYGRLYKYNSSKTLLGGFNAGSATGVWKKADYDSNVTILYNLQNTLGSTCEYISFGGILTGDADDVIITFDEPIA